MSVPSYIGVDPGATGAIGVLQGEAAYAFDVPMRLVKRGDSKKPITDVPALWGLAHMLADMFPGARVCVERVWGAKMQGGSSGAALGHHRAMLEAAFYTAFNAEPELISPQRWKGDLRLITRGVEADKGRSLQLALGVFPAHAALITPVRKLLTEAQCIGRAEALLIAHWQRLQPC